MRESVPARWAGDHVGRIDAGTIPYRLLDHHRAPEHRLQRLDERRQSLDEQTSITVPLVSVDFRITPRLGMQVTSGLPLIVRSGVVPRPSGAMEFRDEVRGFGDTGASVWYRRSQAGWNWTLNGGISIPTGSTRKPRFRPELENGAWCRCRGCSAGPAPGIRW